MLHIIEHALLHSLKHLLELVPLLFLTYLLMEYFEHKFNIKEKQDIFKGRFSILISAVLGAVPQCGISAAAAELYSVRIISLGALIAVFMSSSDEMIPILLSGGMGFSAVIKIVLLKIAIASVIGYIISFFAKPERVSKGHISHVCDDEHCGCESHGIFLSALIHTLNTALFIFVITFALEFVIDYFGLESISGFTLLKPYISCLIMPLIGLIPNCASSVFITQMYLSGVITPAAMICGLLANSGIGILVLFKNNDNAKQNLKILAYLYFMSVIAGLVLELIGLTF